MITMDTMKISGMDMSIIMGIYGNMMWGFSIINYPFG